MQPVTDPGVLAGYLTDASNLQGRADALFRPETTEEVAAIVREAQARAVPLLVTAGRTSTTGGAVPDGGWLLSTERLDAIGERRGDAVTAQAGVLLGHLQTQLERDGWLYPPDPTSRHECTLGASIATNASGARSFKYGPTRPWVTAATVVTPTGEILHVDRTTPLPAGWPAPRWAEPKVKTAAGYPPADNLLDLFIGQEGTLGVLTEATLRLTPAPAAVLGLLAFFPDRDAAVDFMREARARQRADADGPLSPRCIEYLDRHCLALAADRDAAVPDGAGAALFCEQEVTADEDAHLDAWFDALQRHGALADDTLLTTDDAGHQRLHALRHAIPAGVNERVVRNRMRKVGTDLSVPDDALDAMFALYEAAPLEHVLFGHLGDNHLHLNLLPRDAAELEVAKRFYDRLAEAAIAHGGSVSAEHGIGKLKRAHLQRMVGDAVVDGFRALKGHLDPAWILGRGNVIAPPL